MQPARLRVEAHPGVVTLADALRLGATLGLGDGWAISPRQCTWAQLDPGAGAYRSALADRGSTEALGTVAGDAYELTLFGPPLPRRPVGAGAPHLLATGGRMVACELRWIHGHGTVTVSLILQSEAVFRPEWGSDTDEGRQPMAGSPDAWTEVQVQPVRYSTWPPSGSGIAAPGWAVHGEARTSLFCLPADPDGHPAGELAAWEVFALDEESGAWRYHDQITDRLHHPSRR